MKESLGSLQNVAKGQIKKLKKEIDSYGDVVQSGLVRVQNWWDWVEFSKKRHLKALRV